MKLGHYWLSIFMKPVVHQKLLEGVDHSQDVLCFLLPNGQMCLAGLWPPYKFASTVIISMGDFDTFVTVLVTTSSRTWPCDTSVIKLGRTCLRLERLRNPVMKKKDMSPPRRRKVINCSASCFFLALTSLAEIPRHLNTSFRSSSMHIILTWVVQIWKGILSRYIHCVWLYIGNMFWHKVVYH